MQEIESCNFFDLFGINIDGNYVARLNLKFNDKVYEKGFVFEKDKKYSTFIISNHINHFVLIYTKVDYVKLHMFTLNTISKNEMCNFEKEQKLFRFGQFKHIHKEIISKRRHSYLDYISPNEFEKRYNEGS